MIGSCSNCGAVLTGRWCHACGQDARLALRPWRELIAEWSDSVLGWETRTGRTLRTLCLEPGRLTADYAAGRRASWLHPLRLYLGANVFALAVFGATSETIIAHNAADFGPNHAFSHMGSMLLAISSAMVVLLPTVAACYALAFRASGRYYAEHLVYVLHVSTFAFLAQASASLVQYPMALADLPFWSESAVRLTAHAAMVGYGVMAAVRVYGLGLGQTLLRIVLANLLFAPFLAVTVWLMVVSGA